MSSVYFSYSFFDDRCHFMQELQAYTRNGLSCFTGDVVFSHAPRAFASNSESYPILPHLVL